MNIVQGADADRRRRYEALFGQVYEPLQRYVRRRGEGSDADDVVAEALLVLWRRLDDAPPGMELAWSYGIARRCLANHRRSAERRNRLVQRVAVTTAASTVEVNEDPDLDTALAELSADDRELVRLWAWEQLAPREIAAVLDISPNAVSIRLHRAKARLAERLAAAGDVRRKSTAPDGHNRGGHAQEEPL